MPTIFTRPSQDRFPFWSTVFARLRDDQLQSAIGGSTTNSGSGGGKWIIRQLSAHDRESGSFPGDITVLPHKTCLIVVPSSDLPLPSDSERDGRGGRGGQSHTVAGPAQARTPASETQMQWLDRLASIANTCREHAATSRAGPASIASTTPTVIVLVFPHDSHDDESTFSQWGHDLAARRLCESVDDGRGCGRIVTCYLSVARAAEAVDLLRRLAIPALPADAATTDSQPLGPRSVKQVQTANLYRWRTGGPQYPAELIRYMVDADMEAAAAAANSAGDRGRSTGRVSRAENEARMNAVFEAHGSLADCAARSDANFAHFWSSAR